MSGFPYQGRLDTCCICFSLKTGTKLIGFFTWFFCAIQLMSYLVTFLQIETRLPECYNSLALSEASTDVLMTNCFHDSLWIGEACTCVRGMIMFRCMLYLLGFTGSLLLIRGVNKRQPSLFYLWYIYICITIGINLMAFGSFRNPKDSVTKLCASAILVYFFIVTKFFQHQVRLENDGTLPVSAITRPENIHIPGTNLPGCVAMQPKDYPPPPYSLVSPPPPPYSEIKPEDGINAPSSSETPTGTEHGPPPYELSVVPSGTSPQTESKSTN